MSEATLSEIPYLRKTGRYLFYAMCALGVGLEAGCAARLMHVAEFAERAAIDVAVIAAFLALRDMDKAAWRRAAASSAIDDGPSD